MASAKDWRDPADVQPMELTRAKMPWFISSQATREHRDAKVSGVCMISPLGEAMVCRVI